MAGQFINVVIVDDTALIAEAFQFLSGTTADIRLGGYARSLAQATQLFEKDRVDVVVADVILRGCTGFEVVKAALRQRPAMKALFFSGYYCTKYIALARSIGASGWVLKESLTELIHAIRRVKNGCEFLEPSAARCSSAMLIHAPILPLEGKGALTRRQVEVVKLWTDDLETKEIAEKLKISTRTVEAHRAAIMEKLGNRSLAAITKFALLEGITSF